MPQLLVRSDIGWSKLTCKAKKKKSSHDVDPKLSNDVDAKVQERIRQVESAGQRLKPTDSGDKADFAERMKAKIRAKRAELDSAAEQKPEDSEDVEKAQSSVEASAKQKR